MNTKRIISLVASLALVLSLSVGLTGCGDKAAQDDNQGSTDGEGTKYTVGICQLVQHEALDAATQGFIDALNEALPGQVEFQNKNASGDNANCSTIVNGFVSDGVDLIMANATGALTAAAAATSDIPILGTSITAYGVALDIDDFNGTVGGNISGTSDLADLEAQANMITEWFPDATKVGLLFCYAEPNSRYQIGEVAKCLSDKALKRRNLPLPTPTTSLPSRSPLPTTPTLSTSPPITPPLPTPRPSQTFSFPRACLPSAAKRASARAAASRPSPSATMTSA